jgi:hypothetical protein
MAYLIEQSGDGDLVARVAVTNNNARIPELRHDSELVSWLWGNGMTLEEAARIATVSFGPWFSANGASGLSGRITF